MKKLFFITTLVAMLLMSLVAVSAKDGYPRPGPGTGFVKDFQVCVFQNPAHTEPGQGVCKQATASKNGGQGFYHFLDAMGKNPNKKVKVFILSYYE